jgi:hypothetical protein
MCRSVSIARASPLKGPTADLLRPLPGGIVRAESLLEQEAIGR